MRRRFRRADHAKLAVTSDVTFVRSPWSFLNAVVVIGAELTFGVITIGATETKDVPVGPLQVSDETDIPEHSTQSE
jgi:hypothetical protein